MTLPRPRAYVDWTVPVDENGMEIGGYRDEATHQKYIAWLADYLYYTDIPVPACQLETLAEFEAGGGISSAVLHLSDDWGYAVWELEKIDQYISQGLSWTDLHREELRTWESFTDEIREEYGDPDIHFFISEADFERIGREIIEELNVPGHIWHVDIPYRPILARLLKKVESKDERIKYLDRYNYNFNECASK